MGRRRKKTKATCPINRNQIGARDIGKRWWLTMPMAPTSLFTVAALPMRLPLAPPALHLSPSRRVFSNCPFLYFGRAIQNSNFMHFFRIITFLILRYYFLWSRWESQEKKVPFLCCSWFQDFLEYSNGRMLRILELV